MNDMSFARDGAHIDQNIAQDRRPLPLAAAQRKHDADRSGGSLWKWGAAGAALAASAVYNVKRARKAERDNPPSGRFTRIDDVEIQYAEAGDGDPILLIHGNGAMIADWRASGLFDALAATNRVIAIDRPGFGHSDRPRATLWTPQAQARLIAGFLTKLGIEKPLVVGHSFGTQVALALALDHPEQVSGLVLMSGYYFPSFRVDVALLSPPAIPVIGDAIRYTVSPLLTEAMRPLMKRHIFAPAPVHPRFAGFPFEMVARPSQIRAEAEETAMMIPAAAKLSKRYGELDLPVALIAGRGDKIVDPLDQSARLHETIPGSRLELVDGAGHMIHYTALDQVAQLIKDSADRA